MPQQLLCCFVAGTQVGGMTMLLTCSLAFVKRQSVWFKSLHADKRAMSSYPVPPLLLGKGHHDLL